MRPVNLIPQDERRGGSKPTRTGSLAYVVVGALVAVLAGVTSLVLTGNTVSEREAEVAQLEQQEEAARARAESLRAFADFSLMQHARAETVSSLAKSRFDWERVLRELALVLPKDVWLVSLSGKVSQDVTLEGEVETSIGDDIAGPSLSMIGCGAGHDSVARFVAALEDIDGVTRVGLATSELGSSAASESSSGSSSEDCRVRDFISRFEIVVAFDEAGAPEAVASAPAAPSAGTANGEQNSQTATSTQGG